MIPLPDPKDDPATRQNIRHGKILSEPQGMPHGEHIEAAAEFELRGVLGQPETEHEEVRDAFIPLALEMVLRHPENVIAQRLHTLGSVFGDLKSLDKPLVGVPSVVGGCPTKTYAFAFEHMAGIERRDIANHGPSPSLCIRTSVQGLSAPRRFLPCGLIYTPSTVEK